MLKLFYIFLNTFYTLASPINYIIKPLRDQTDAELILLWQQGNDTAFATIYDKYVLQLLIIAMDKVRDREIAEELAQDTFISFYKSSVSLEKLNSIMAFLYVILKNKIMDWHRQNIKQQKYADYLRINFRDSDDSTRSLIETRELEALLKAEIEKLPQQCRKVFKLRRGEFMSNKDIALHLNISENTVEQHMRKALRILRISFFNQDLILLFILIRIL